MMEHFFHDSPYWRRKASRSYLAFSWLAGLVCGCLAWLWAEDSAIPLMRSVLFAPVSIVGTLCVPVIPILISAYAVFLSNFVLLLLTCFGKAFLVSFTALGISRMYTSAGWLMQMLLLFSSWTSLPILYWFWLRISEHAANVWEAVFLCSLLILLGSIHYGIISPFLVRLIGI